MVLTYIALGLFAVAAIELILLITAKKRFIKKHVVTIEDNIPATDTVQARALQLSNELSNFIHTQDGKLFLKLFKD